MAETLFFCDRSQWQRFAALCREADQTPGTVLRDLIRLEIQRRERRAARSDEVIDERLLGRLRLLVAEALAEAGSWVEAQARLRARGLDYVPKGGGLLLIDADTGEVLCKGSKAGPGYLDLVIRFGTGFPDHPRPGLALTTLRQGGNTRPAGARTGVATRRETSKIGASTRV
ncbi:hypothetical protein OU426_06780 [Frigidibacter sp. RF13]|uniref:hypothetical protein n=1 Tax=Frigidibacter sp. RF13 TaxID=2997340 RepID=UPI00226D838B|nr:hypothetical protein [Frigidibacter sp. RF13]MCY1126553.1 hypothetical protein [Frigidibacter sp. RF13]